MSELCALQMAVPVSTGSSGHYSASRVSCLYQRAVLILVLNCGKIHITENAAILTVL